MRTSGTIHMYNGWDAIPLIFCHAKNRDHERIQMGPAENLAARLFSQGWSKWPEPLSELYLFVQQLAHIRPPRIRQETPVPQGARAEFHPPLEPANDRSICDEARHPRKQ